MSYKQNVSRTYYSQRVNQAKRKLMERKYIGNIDVCKRAAREARKLGYKAMIISRPDNLCEVWEESPIKIYEKIRESQKL